MSDSSQKETYTPKELAKIIGISPKTLNTASRYGLPIRDLPVYEWRRPEKGRLKHYEVPVSYNIKKEG